MTQKCTRCKKQLNINEFSTKIDNTTYKTCINCSNNRKKNHKTCEQDGCETRPTFNIKGSKNPRFCFLHKTVDMVDIKSKTCEQDGCETQPTFNIKGSKTARFCSLHKTVDMVDIKNKTCEQDGCETYPIFNIKGSKTRRFCSLHKTAGMVDIKHKTCEQDGCETQPTFNIKGSKTRRFCSLHKTVDMVDIKSKTCEQDGCETRPTFNIKGSKNARFCSLHKTVDMVDIKSKTCEQDGCETRPTFNIKGSKNARFCSLHKTVDMVDIKHKTCEENGCKTRPNFNIKGSKNARFCSLHKTVDMVNIISKTCEQDGCETTAYYGKPGYQKSHCFQHRKIGMIRKPNAKCSKCKQLAIWGINWIPKHCENHKTEDDKNLVERECISCGLLYILDDENKCSLCNPESFMIARLAKQNALMNYLDARDLKGVSTDIVIDKGECGKERPDRVYDFGDKIVILECDEHQHRDRQCLCEQTRMVNIGQSFGGIPVYFIRWNPDDYCPDNDRKNPEIISNRYKLVGDLIRDIKNNKHKLPIGLVSVIYLYYDGWNSITDSKWEVITNYD